MTWVPPWIGATELAANSHGGGPPPPASFMLQETGFFVLQENGSKIQL